MSIFTVCLLGMGAGAIAGPILFDGRFNDLNCSAPLAQWTWGNAQPPYQYYLHGLGPVEEYIALSPAFKNPADTGSIHGARITIDNTSHWWLTPPLQTSLIPQTNASINEGKAYYHFSLSISSEHTPDPSQEHCLFYFSSLFSKLTYSADADGCGLLSWATDNATHWSAPLEPGAWHNFAYAIDFDGGSVALHHSLGAAELEPVAGPISVDAESDFDWHVGAIIPSGIIASSREEWFVSGVYVERGPLTVCPAGPAEPQEAWAGTTTLPLYSYTSSVSSVATRASRAPADPTGGTSTVTAV